MNTLDIIILICFIPAVIRGLRKGFIEQAIALISIVLGGWLAYKFSSQVSIWLQPYLDMSETVLNVVSFALIVLVVVLALFLLGRLLTGIVKLVLLGWLDRLLGLLFAIFKAAIIIGLVITLFDSLNSHLPLIKQETLDSSVVYNAIKGFTSKIFPFVENFIQQHNVK